MIIRTCLKINGKNKYMTFDFPNKEVYVNSMIKIISDGLFNELKMFKNFNLKDQKFINALSDSYCEKSNLRKIRKHIQSFYPDLSDSIIQKKFWLERGWDEDYTNKRVSEIQKRNGIKFAEKIKKDPSIRISPNQIEYYIRQGYSEEEAKKLLSEHQRTFTLEKCIQKYGEEKGREVFNKRQEKWQKTLNQRFTKKEQNQWLAKGGLISKESLNLFLPFYEKLKNKYTCYIGLNGISNEYSLNFENMFFRYDFTLLEPKLIFEYQGSHVHPNPNWSKEKWNNWRHCFNKKTADEIQLKYNKKIQAAEAAGFQVIQLWDEDGFEKNKQIISSYLGKL